jgi:hypothetical protein
MIQHWRERKEWAHLADIAEGSEGADSGSPA